MFLYENYMGESQYEDLTSICLKLSPHTCGGGIANLMSILLSDEWLNHHCRDKDSADSDLKSRDHLLLECPNNANAC